MAAFIAFEGIEGESLDKEHQKWSDLLSFGQSISKPGKGSGQTRRRGDIVVDDMRVTKELDKASPKLAQAICRGKVFKNVNIELTASYGNEGRVTYYAYELKNVLVVKYNVSGAGQTDEAPVEEIALNFEEVRVTYTVRSQAGNRLGHIEYAWKVDRAAI